MVGLCGPPQPLPASHGGQQAHTGHGGPADHGGRPGHACQGHQKGAGTNSMGNFSVSIHQVDAAAAMLWAWKMATTTAQWGGHRRWSGCWPSCCVSSSTRLSSSTPLTCQNLLGGAAFVGGWCSNKVEPVKAEVYWFHEQIHISMGLEMLGTLFLYNMMALCPPG